MENEQESESHSFLNLTTGQHAPTPGTTNPLINTMPKKSINKNQTSVDFRSLQASQVADQAEMHTKGENWSII